MELRDYQQRAIREVYQHFTGGRRRVVLVAPTGSGKTVMAARIISDAVRRHRRVVFLAHRRELIFQCADKLARFGVRHGLVLAGENGDSDAPCQVASIETINQGNYTVPSLGDGDLVITDECHRVDAIKLRSTWPGAWHLGLTATPVRLVGDRLLSLAGEYDALVQASTPRELVASGAIVPARILAPVLPDLSAVRTGRGGEFAAAALGALMGEPGIIRNVVDTLVKLPPAKSVLFACNVKHAKQLAAELTSAGRRAVVVTGESMDRESILAQFHDATDHPTICNADLLIEGWDPDPNPSEHHQPLSRVILCRPTRSLTLFLQQVGRGVRPHPGKPNMELIDFAGNTVFHGDPYESRPWTLDANDTKRRTVNRASIWRCPTCFCLSTGECKICPYCGTEVRRKSVRLKYVDGKLTEYDEQELAKLAELRARLLEQEHARKMENKEHKRAIFSTAYQLHPGNRGAATRWAISMLARFRSGTASWAEFSQQHGIR